MWGAGGELEGCDYFDCSDLPTVACPAAVGL